MLFCRGLHFFAAGPRFRPTTAAGEWVPVIFGAVFSGFGQAALPSGHSLVQTGTLLQSSQAVQPKKPAFGIARLRSGALRPGSFARDVLLGWGTRFFLRSRPWVSRSLEDLLGAVFCSLGTGAAFLGYVIQVPRLERAIVPPTDYDSLLIASLFRHTYTDIFYLLLLLIPDNKPNSHPMYQPFS